MDFPGALHEGWPISGPHRIPMNQAIGNRTVCSADGTPAGVSLRKATRPMAHRGIARYAFLAVSGVRVWRFEGCWLKPRFHPALVNDLDDGGCGVMLVRVSE